MRGAVICPFAARSFVADGGMAAKTGTLRSVAKAKTDMVFNMDVSLIERALDR
jgi:hypothetical protein